MTGSEIPVRFTLADQVCGLLRQDILMRRIQPGSRLTVNSIAKRYNTSPIPVREAIHTLVGERLLDMQAYKGATVRLIDEKFVSDTYDIMRVLEGLAMEGAVGQVNDALMCELTRQNELMLRLYKDGRDNAALFKSNRVFHNRIEAFCRNERALETLKVYRHIVFTMWEQYTDARVNRVEMAYQEHLQILDALRSGDLLRAQVAYTAHSMSAKQSLLAAWTADIPSNSQT